MADHNYTRNPESLEIEMDQNVKSITEQVKTPDVPLKETASLIVVRDISPETMIDEPADFLPKSSSSIKKKAASVKRCHGRPHPSVSARVKSPVGILKTPRFTVLKSNNLPLSMFATNRKSVRFDLPETPGLQFNKNRRRRRRAKKKTQKEMHSVEAYIGSSSEEDEEDVSLKRAMLEWEHRKMLANVTTPGRIPAHMEARILLSEDRISYLTTKRPKHLKRLRQGARPNRVRLTTSTRLYFATAVL